VARIFVFIYVIILLLPWKAEGSEPGLVWRDGSGFDAGTIAETASEETPGVASGPGSGTATGTIPAAERNDCTFTPALNGNATACEGSSGNVYTTDPGGTGYTWAISAGGFISAGGGTNTVTVTWTTAGAQWISIDFTSATGCTTTAPTVLDVTVNALLPASLTIVVSANPVCQGTTANFTATPANGGATPSYQWQVNGVNQGTNSPNFSYVPANNDQVKCIMTSSYGCATGSPATSNTVLMAVSNNLPVSVSIVASPSGQICQGTIVTYTATPVNGGSSPSYQWMVNGVNSGTNSATFSYAPANAEVISCVLTSNTPCASGNPATSNAITANVIASIPVSVSISASNNPVCAGVPVTFTATPVNGGSNPTYQWVVNSAGAGTNSATFIYSPANGDLVSCYLLSSLGSCVTNNPATSNVITMTVYLVLPVSISISASANPICAGTSVTFTAAPVNGGPTPTLQWKVNGVNVGTNSSTYTYIPLNNDLISCILTSSEPCPLGSPAASNTIAMSVSTVLPVNVSIAASANPSCPGAAVTYTATPVNGGSLPIYEWYLNGLVVGGLGATYTYIPSAGDQVQCRLTSYLSCTTNNPAFSNVITMSLATALPVSVTITASQNPFCQGNPVNFTATPVNGGNTPIYNWQVNGVSQMINGPNFSYIPSNGDVVWCIIASNAYCATGNPAASNTLVMIQSPDPPLPVSVSITASANPVCSGSPVTIHGSPVNGGSAPVYQWRVNGLPAGTNSADLTYIPVNGDLVSCILSSSLFCTSGNPASSNNIQVSVSPYLPVSVSISATANPVCLGTTVIFTATPVNGGSSPAYQWKVNGVNAGSGTSTYSYAPANGDLVSCILTSSLSCPTGSPATSNVLAMTVNSNPVSVSISASANPVCSGSPVTVHGSPVNGGSAPVYQWMVNGLPAGTNSADLTYIPVNGDLVSCILTSNFSCPTGSPATSNTITMTVNNPLPVSITISASGNPVCSGSPVTVHGSPVNGGSAPVYQWKVNGLPTGTNSADLTYIPVNGDLVSCILTSSASCISGNPATSNVISMTVNASMPVSVNISASSNPVCQGNPVTFNASPVNGGPAPGYQWKLNGSNVGTNSSSYAYVPVNGDLVTCILTSSYTCGTGNPATSNLVTMIVLPYLPVSVTISASANPVCSGSPVTVHGSPVNGGSAPVYQWLVNGVPAGTNSADLTYIPVNGDLVSCILTSSYACASWNPATSNVITMAVNPSEPVSISITSSANPSCNGSPVTVHGSPVNGGSAPVYQWKVNGLPAGTNSADLTYIPVNGDLVSCILTSNSTCPTGNPALSNIILQSVLPNLPVSVTIAASANPSCQGVSVTFTASTLNGGGSPSYQWKVNGLNAGFNSNTYSYIPLNGDLVSCILTSNLLCATGNPALSNIIPQSVNPSQPVSVTITPSSNPACTGSTVVFTAVPTNGGPGPSYQWKVNGTNAGTNSSTFAYTPANGDLVSCILTSNTTCPTGNPATSNTITMQVSPGLTISCSIQAFYNPSCQGGTVLYNAYPTNGGSNPSYQWQVNGVNVGTNNFQFFYIPVNGDLVSCILTSSYGCPLVNPVTSNIITQSVVPNLGGVGVSVAASANPCCAGDSVTFTATVTNGGLTPTYQWQVNHVNVGYNSPNYKYPPVNGDTIVCVLLSSLTCTSGNPASSFPLRMTVLPTNAVSVSITTSSTLVCQGTDASFTAAVVNPGSSPVYQWKVNGVNSGTNSTSFTYTPSNGDLVSCILTSDIGCPAGNPATSNMITLTVDAIFPVSITISSPVTTVCAGSPVTVHGSPVNGGSAPVYQWLVNGLPAGTNSADLTYIPVNGDLVSCILTSSLSCSSGSPATSNTIPLTVNPYLTPSVTINTPTNAVCSGTLVTFTAFPVNGGSSPVYQWQVNGTNAGTNSSTFSFVPSNNDLVSCILTSSYSCLTANPVTSNVIQITVNPMLPVSLVISTPVNPVCDGSPVTVYGSPVNGGSAPSYQWLVNGLNYGANSPLFSYIPSNNDLVSCILTSNALCSTGNPATSNTIQISTVPSLPVSITISASANPVCNGSPVTVHGSPVNGGSAPSYQWLVNGLPAGTNSADLTYIPVNGDLVSCILTSSYGCPAGNPATSNTVTMGVTPSQPVSITISTTTNPVCNGSPVTVHGSPVNGGPAPVYQWMVNGLPAGTNSADLTYIPVNGDLVSCILTSNTICPTGNPAQSNNITLTVNPYLPVSITISTPVNPVCNGSPVTVHGSPVNGGSAPVYQWLVNGQPAGTNSADLTYIPVNGDLVSCILSSSLSCISGNPATSNLIQLTVNPNLPVGVTITASNNPSCPGSPVTFHGSPVNGGSAPVYQWLVNGLPAGTNSADLTFTPALGDLVSCILTSNAACISGNPATSNTIIVSNTAPAPVSVTTTASANPVCQGSSSTFTAIPVNGGSNPAFQWKVNGVNSGTNSSTFTYNPSTNDLVSCILTSSYGCPTGNPATSNTVYMTVSPLLPVSVTVTTPQNPVCENSPTTFTANPVNGGPNPSYQWKVNGINSGTSSSAFTYIPLNNDLVSCILTSNTQCAGGNPATSPPLTVGVTPGIPVSVSITASGNSICAGTVVTFTASPVNGGLTPNYQWVVNGSGAGSSSPVFIYTPANGDQVSCYLQSSIANCAVNNPAASNVIAMTVYTVLPVSISISASANPLCSGSPVTVHGSPVNGGSAPVYQWMVNGLPAGTNSADLTYTPFNGDLVSCILLSSYPCPTGNPAASNTIAMSVIPVLPVSVSVGASANPVCAGTSVTFTAIPVNGGVLPIYQWYKNGLAVGTMSSTYTYIPVNGDQVWCQVTSYLTCTTGNPALSNTVQMTVNPSDPVSLSITASANPFCTGSPVTINGSPVNGGSAPVYQWLVNGVTVGTNSPTYTYMPSNGDAVTCNLTSSAQCPVPLTAGSNTLVMLLSPDPVAPVTVSINVSANPVCTLNPVMFTATPVNGGSSPAYQWKVNGSNQGISSTVFSYTPANADQVKCVLTSSSVCATGNPATSNIITIIKQPLLVSVDLCNPVTTHDGKPFILGFGLPLGGTWSGVGVTGNIFTPASVPPGRDTVTVTYNCTNVAGCSAASSEVVHLYPSTAGFVCGSPFTDPRDSKSYPSVLIGAQCWMAQNLDYGTFLSVTTYQTDNCLAEKYCYNDLPANCPLKGALYQWDELLQYQGAPGSQGLCPPAWHIPIQAEWTAMETVLYGAGNAGDSLKAGGFSGFNALLPGIIYSKTTWKFNGFATFFWTSTITSLDRALSHALNQPDKSVSYYPALRSNAFSVRCVKD